MALGLSLRADCFNALGCDSLIGCGLTCRYRGAGHGDWGAAQAQNCYPLAGACQGDAGALQGALLAQNAYAGLAQQAAGVPAFALAGIGAGLGGLFGGFSQLPGAAPRQQSFEKLPHDGIEIGEVIAWRCWRLTRRGLLQSASMDHLWLPDQPMTGEINYTGVHAWKDPAAAAAMFERNLAGDRAWGAVALWGELVEHERGFRAENARVVAIEAVASSRRGHILGRITGRRRLDRLRDRYGVGSWADYQAENGERAVKS